MSVLCLGGFLYLNGHVFLEILEILCYYCVEYIMYTFGLHLFFKAHESQVWSSDGIAEILCMPFIALESFV
jgi:hypothetical protein